MAYKLDDGFTRTSFYLIRNEFILVLKYFCLACTLFCLLHIELILVFKYFLFTFSFDLGFVMRWWLELPNPISI